MIECIWLLNDVANWTRERIADWVETIEDAQVVPVEVQQEQEAHA